MMRYVRPVDRANFASEPYAVQDLFRGESCTILLSRVKAHESAPPQHEHLSDQIYYVLAGWMHIQLGSEIFVVDPHSVVFIPAGVPHHNWNEGDQDEIHFELIVPPTPPRAPAAYPTDSTDAKGLPYYVRPVDPDGFDISASLRARLTPEQADEVRSKMVIQRLVERASGCGNCTLYAAKVFAEGGGPGMHVHDFDQFYWVLSGELHIEVAFTEHVAGPDTLVVLPAGVPHQQWNGGSETEQHLALIVPQPLDGVPWDVGVEYALSEEPPEAAQVRFAAPARADIR